MTHGGRIGFTCCSPPFRVSVIEVVASLLVGVFFVVVPVAGGWRATTP
jgi:hypothetical protein